MNSLVADEPRGDFPSDARHPKGEWRCDIAECAVRDVRIEAYHHGDVPASPPSMTCPACGVPLRFEPSFRDVRLVPASPPPDRLLAQA